LPDWRGGQRWSAMFAGIVEEKGELRLFEKRAAAWRLAVGAKIAIDSTAVGDSIAVNGCCLTVVACSTDTLEFEMLEESRRLTNIGVTPVGGPINLERSLRPDGRLGGHFVTGHIDTLGTIETLERRGADVFLKVSLPAKFGSMLVTKGSIAIDGVSLTVVDVGPDWLTVWLIPHTLEVTTLGTRKAGDAVNLEFDLLAKYVARAVESMGGVAK
jgi:riboflavin synthase